MAEVTFDRGDGELMSGTSDDESHAVQRKLLAASAKNFAAMLDRQADAHPNRIAFLTPSGPDDEPNTWLPMTFAESVSYTHLTLPTKRIV